MALAMIRIALGEGEVTKTASVMSLKYGNLFGSAGVPLPKQGGCDDADCEDDYFD